MSNKIPKILLIGNGFDLRTGVKTTFREFFRFVIYGIIWHNYSKSEVLKTIITNDNNLRFKVNSKIPPETLFHKYFEEKINKKIQVIANIQKEKEKNEWEKEHNGEKLLPSKHPLEILLEIENEEKKEEKEETVFDLCRKLIETEFGQRFFKHLLKSPYLVEALKIDLSSPVSWLFGYQEDENSHRWSVIYGLKDSYAEMGENNCIPNDTNLAEGLETIAHIVEANFDLNRKNIALWSDVETVIELLITRNPYLKTKYNFNLEDDKFPIWDNSTLESFSYGLDIFEILLTKYLYAIQNIDITKDNAKTFFNDIVSNHIESLTSRSCGAIDEDVARELLDISNANIVINYNYTNIAERFFKEIHSPEQKDKIIHINGSIQTGLYVQNEFETNIVIGYTNFCNDNIPKELYPFEKTCRRIIKNTGYVDINEFIEDSWFDLIIIGHSCGNADSDVIGKLLCHKKLNNAVILCHTKYDLVSNFNNVKKIINSENNREGKNNKLNTFSDLTSYTRIFRCVDDNKPANKLFFAVEHPKK